MKTDQFGRSIVDSDDAFTALYNGSPVSLDILEFDDPKIVTQFNQAVELNADPIKKIKQYEILDVDLLEFDKENQSNWFMGDAYKDLDIETWIMQRCDTDTKMRRAQDELVLFRQHNMIDVLRYCKYLVDIMRYNNIVWGVGRGSSVASYVLYLIGIHKIDSIKYDLDIKEFLK
jgi:DNA polymerase III alpha subunit